MSYPKYPDTYKKVFAVGDKEITVEIGKYSEQVSAAVLVTCGETVVHSTVALGRKVDLGYFPLSVEFAEKLFAAGIIKGSRWVKRDGRPLDEVILKARVIDRSLRPMFPDGLTNEVQVINTVFSFDGENDPDMLGLIGSAVGLAVSEIPFDGPLAGLRVGLDKTSGEFLLNPTYTQRDNSDLDLVVSGTGSTIVMVEAGANEVSEAKMVDALVLAQEECGKICTVIEEIVKAVGKEKVELISEEDQAKEQKIAALAEKIYAGREAQIRTIVEKEGRLEEAGVAEFKETVLAELNEGVTDDELLVTSGEVSAAVSSLLKKEARAMIINERVRPDGRQTDEIRQIWVETDVFPRTHGSAMFKRGATQAVSVVTLADPTRSQLIESIQGENTINYIHHYSMPPYASGEAGRFGAPKRREIGHGALAERALLPMIPAQEEFPYTIHVVSEIMSSNGSTSQASVCGSTLALMAAGVPIKRPVAGIAMGLMSDGKKYVVLSDIQGLEDHVGDMDFKVAGTEMGITAIQMDIKLKGVPRAVLEEALEQARTGRLHIMGKMLAVIAEPRKAISEYAPKVAQLTIPADRIGELIGPGGKMIKSIIETTGAAVNVDENDDNTLGIVNISSPDQAKIDAAVAFISNMMRTVEIGEEFDGPVTRVEPFGAFVEYLPGKEGLVHVSRMSTEFVQDAASMVKLGDVVHVRISEIKDDGKIGLSMLTKEQEEAGEASRGSNGGGRSGGNRGFGGGSDRGGRRPAFRGGRSGGRSDFGSERRPDRADRGSFGRGDSDQSGFRRRDR